MFRQTEMIMGLPISLSGGDELLLRSVSADVFHWFKEVDKRFSTYSATSEIARYNRGEITFVQASDYLKQVISACDQLKFQTGGFFDAEAAALVQSEGKNGLLCQSDAPALEPSGYVKGWAADRAVEMISAVGARNFMLDVGGDLYLSGDGPGGDGWMIGVQHPIELDRVAKTLRLKDQAVATSGTYRRGTHIIDPTNGLVADSLLSVTCIASKLVVADAFATAAFAMGEQAATWLQAQRHVEGIVITNDHRLVMTAGVDS